VEQRKFLEGDTLYTLLINCDTSRVFLLGVGPKKKYILHRSICWMPRWEDKIGMRLAMDWRKLLICWWHNVLYLLVLFFSWCKYSH